MLARQWDPAVLTAAARTYSGGEKPPAHREAVKMVAAPSATDWPRAPPHSANQQWKVGPHKQQPSKPISSEGWSHHWGPSINQCWEKRGEITVEKCGFFGEGGVFSLSENFVFFNHGKLGSLLITGKKNMSEKNRALLFSSHIFEQNACHTYFFPTLQNWKLFWPWLQTINIHTLVNIPPLTYLSSSWQGHYWSRRMKW